MSSYRRARDVAARNASFAVSVMLAANAAAAGATPAGDHEYPDIPGQQLSATRSPDGKWLVLEGTSEREASDERLPGDLGLSRHDLWIFHRQTKALTRLTDDHASLLLGNAPFSPDCRRIAFLSSYDLYVMNVDGTAKTRVFAHVPLSEGDGVTLAWTWSWSPDGNSLAVVDRFQSSWDEVFRRGDGDPLADVTVVSADGKHRVPLTSDASGWKALWSPDGRYLAIQDEGAVFVVAPDGSKRVRVLGTSQRRAFAHRGEETSGRAPVIAEPECWTPNGRFLVGSLNYDGATSRIVVADVALQREIFRSAPEVYDPVCGADGSVSAEVLGTPERVLAAQDLDGLSRKAKKARARAK